MLLVGRGLGSRVGALGGNEAGAEDGVLQHFTELSD